MANNLKCFKAYDIRGQIGDDLNESIAWKIGVAYGKYLNPRKIAVGGDIRHSTQSLKAALIDGLISTGVDVLDLGLTGTEEIYYAVISQSLDGGIEVTGSHNPKTDNGLKLVRAEARPISGDTGLLEIKNIAENLSPSSLQNVSKGKHINTSFKEEFVDYLLQFINFKNIRPTSIIANCGHGAAGPILKLISNRFIDLQIPIKFEFIGLEPNGDFPLGLPNPLLPENRKATSKVVIERKADLGLAWDGDFDRCFFFDETGEFVESYYLVGLFARHFLAENPGAAIVHDPRLVWNTIDLVNAAGGRPVVCKTGHAFIKEKMRQEKAIYGGEMSAHHYFSNFSYCDSGMITWLILLAILYKSNNNLSSLVSERKAKFPCSSELNYNVKSTSAVLDSVLNKYEKYALTKNFTDGLSLEMPNWRFNLRSSNTEQLLRLNLETRCNNIEIKDMIYDIEKTINLFTI
ncbi:MAG: phosphomannomutase CpsG [Deltaproteobacteria bacterium]|nr:phosphomannomutase CpsG [Deltaproteobacteria bacterium]